MTTQRARGRKVSIPPEIWAKLGISEGTPVQIEVNEDTGQIVLTPLTRARVEKVFGKFRGKGLLDELKAKRQREKETQRW